jgi:EmrB/QacA subfamily drug resistance transporter
MSKPADAVTEMFDKRIVDDVACEATAHGSPRISSLIERSRPREILEEIRARSELELVMMGGGVAAVALPRHRFREDPRRRRSYKSNTAAAPGGRGSRAKADSDQAVGPHTPASRSRRQVILIASLLATFMSAVEGTIVATAMPTVIGELGGFRLFSWVFTAYLLSMAISVPVYGRLADIFGRKRVFFAGTGMFLAGSISCGFAPTMPALVLSRTIQGLGAGAIQPLSSIILSDVYGPAERARIQGFVSLVFGVSAIGGPAIGAFIVENLHWSLVFWINLPIGAAALLMYGLFLRERPGSRDRQIDWLGCTLLVLGVGSVMLALVQARALGVVGIPVVILGFTALIFLFLHERRVADPIVPYRLWRNRVIPLGNLGTFMTFVTMMAVTASLPAYVQGVMGKSPALGGYVLGSQAISWTLATFAAARVMTTASYRKSVAIGGMLLVAACVMLSLIQPTSRIVWLFAASLTMGLGVGFATPTFLVSVQASVEWEERGSVTGSIMFMRILGQSWGATLFGAVLNLGIASRLPNASNAANWLLTPHSYPLNAPQMATVQTAVADSMHEVYLVVLAIAALVLALSRLYPSGLRAA